jgi:hypothetical protein
MIKIDLSNKIERLHAFEEKFSVHIENAAAWFDNEEENISIFFETHPRSGTTISRNLKAVVSVFNNRGQIVTTEEVLYLAENFWGFETSLIALYDLSWDDISKIRIYPAAW